MFVEKDPKIKLFGKTIELPGAAAAAAAPVDTSLPILTRFSVAAEEDGSHQDPACSSDSMLEGRNLDVDADEQESIKSLSDTKQDAVKDGDVGRPLMSEELIDSNRIRPITEDLSTPLADDGAVGKKTSKTEDQSGVANSQDKTLKKPDKILPCPRCNSMETKFCYFNNYNVNQPRHFCKNCHRYWTAGGTMRNVPVGAGRRKNKNTVSQFRNLTVRDALQSAQVDIPNVIHSAALNPNNSTVLTFNSDSPQCESMTSALNISDESIINSARNGFHMSEVNLSVSHGSKVNQDDPSVGTFTSTASSKGDRSKSVLPESTSNFLPVPPQVPCFPGAPWPFPWHSDPWSSQISPPTFSPASFPVPPFFSTTLPYWGCAVPSTWNVPWVFPPMPTAIQCDTPQSSTGPNSPTLGKHSRDENHRKSPNGNEAETLKESSSEKSLWIPKTLRIDDPEEAAKSSIWETLGIKHDSVDSPGEARLFKPFQSQSNSDEKSNVLETSSVLHANPAALSRALTFQESS